MLHDEYWLKLIYIEVKRSKGESRVTKAVPAWVFALLRVLASSSYTLIFVSFTGKRRRVSASYDAQISARFGEAEADRGLRVV